MAIIDDASGELLEGTRFVDQACAAGKLTPLPERVPARGPPHATYTDRDGSLRWNDDHWTPEEELRGAQDPMQVGRALRAPGITPNSAGLPQAKRRVERSWDTAQDRRERQMKCERVASWRWQSIFDMHGRPAGGTVPCTSSSADAAALEAQGEVEELDGGGAALSGFASPRRSARPVRWPPGSVVSPRS